MTVKFSDGSSESELGMGGVKLVFDRASGALKTLNDAGQVRQHLCLRYRKEIPCAKWRLYLSRAEFL